MALLADEYTEIVISRINVHNAPIQPGPSSSPRTFEMAFVLAIIGLTAMYVSPGLGFLGSGLIRIGALGVGFLLVGIAAWLRGQSHFERYWLICGATVTVLLWIFFLTAIRGHWIDRQGLVFIGVCGFLFLFGFMLGESKDRTVSGFGRAYSILLALLCFGPLLLFLRFVESVAFYGVDRGYGMTELNPIGIAYMAGVVFQILIALGFTNRSVWLGIPILGIAGMALVIIVTSGSKGALLSIGIANAVLFFQHLWRKGIPRGSIVWSTSALCFLLLIALLLNQCDFALIDRVSITQTRFQTTIDHFQGIGGDESIDARLELWSIFLEEPTSWMLMGKQFYAGYPHNQFVELIVRFGILGFLLSCMSIWMFARSIFIVLNRSIPMDAELLVILGIFFFSFLQSLTSLNLEMNRSLWFTLGFLLGFGARLRRMERCARQVHNGTIQRRPRKGRLPLH